MNIISTVTINEDDIVEDIFRDKSYEEVIEFITKIDLSAADVGFTSDLIVKLLESLLNEVPNDQKEIADKFYSTINFIKSLDF